MFIRNMIEYRILLENVFQSREQALSTQNMFSTLSENTFDFNHLTENRALEEQF